MLPHLLTAILPLADDPSTDEAVAQAVDIAQLLLAVVIGMVVGALIAVVFNLIIRAITRRSVLTAGLLRRVRVPGYIMMMGWGAYFATTVALSMQGLSDTSNTVWVQIARHVLLIICILLTTWALYSCTWLIEDAARRRQKLDLGNANRFETQAQVLRRLLQVVVIIIGICGVLFTFPGAQQALGTLLASAGVLGVVAGLAAQSTLGNVFAGLQLAFTDAIRVGDVVVAGPKAESGAIEEITLTYVVVRVWDERRLIMPSTEFTTKAFENWTRRAAKQLGTVELRLNWNAPMALLRQKVEQLLLATDLWDGRTWNVQMTESDQDTVTVRILVSAADSGHLWDLRCYLRENLIAWINTDEQWARPAQRIQPLDTVVVQDDRSREDVARLARELSDIANTDPGAGTGGAPASAANTDGITPTLGFEDPETADAVHAARLHAARRKAKKARRRSLFERQAEKSRGLDGAPDGAAGAGAGVRAGAGAGGSGPGKLGALPVSSAASPADIAPSQTHIFTMTEQAELANRYDLTSVDPRTGAPAPGAQDRPSADSVVMQTRPAVPDGASVTRDPAKPITAETAVAPPPPPPAASAVPGASAAPPTGGGAHSAGRAPDDDPSQTATGNQGERLFSGDPEAEKRGQVFSGPGEDVIAEREATAQFRAQRDKAIPPEPPSTPVQGVQGVPGVAVPTEAGSPSDGDASDS